MLELWPLLLLLTTADSKVDNSVRYDSLIGRRMNVFTPYDGAKQLVCKTQAYSIFHSVELEISNG